MRSLVRRLPVAASLLVCAVPALLGQGCTDQATRVNFGMGSAVVSVQELRTPVKAWQHLEQARKALARNDGTGVLHESTSALAVAPHLAQAHLLQAIWFLRNGQNDDARAAAGRAQALNAQLPWSGVILAGALVELHQDAEALSVLDRVQTGEARSWQAYYERARAAIALGRVDDALRWSDLAVSAAPAGCTQTRLVRANALTVAGHRAEAVTQMQCYLAEDRQGGARHEQVALALRGTGQNAEPLIETIAEPQAQPSPRALGAKLSGQGNSSRFQ